MHKLLTHYLIKATVMLAVAVLHVFHNFSVMQCTPGLNAEKAGLTNKRILKELAVVLMDSTNDFFHVLLLLIIIIIIVAIRSQYNKSFMQDLGRVQKRE